MTRIGKIARLPRALREQINHRLEEGEPGVDIVAWLNALPEVQAVLQAEFAGRPIKEQNLSEWKQGGYRDWQKHQEALALACEFSAHAAELAKVGGEPLSDVVSPLLLTKYMAILQSMGTVTGGEPGDWKLLRELCSDLVALRKGDHSAERLKLERDKWHWGVC